uniref:Uncharacterized protein n=1 Tax=Ditylenchus dipsaci TaxID=166011 RepID=A0A915DS28_9BILA
CSAVSSVNSEQQFPWKLPFVFVSKLSKPFMMCISVVSYIGAKSKVVYIVGFSLAEQYYRRLNRRLMILRGVNIWASYRNFLDRSNLPIPCFIV